MLFGQGSTPPAGWQFCDGTNNSPDLRNKFIKGSNIEGIGTTGGKNSDEVTGGDHNHIGGAHDHTISGGTHTFNIMTHSEFNSISSVKVGLNSKDYGDPGGSSHHPHHSHNHGHGKGVTNHNHDLSVK